MKNQHPIPEQPETRQELAKHVSAMVSDIKEIIAKVNEFHVRFSMHWKLAQSPDQDTQARKGNP